ncbi:hypothetical protein RND71_029606 [Anisodus tanguticus]|uniref:GDSL esterase/lipase n=1 Tax=Anisodus tanguticus TaxID=243964 RepID=A0AAE1REU9_9SOLA|nr:hypothetical protein RND71_029606 [Anisodus tanguticus]
MLATITSSPKALLARTCRDFGNGLPNGRFCNGRTVADIIGDEMGLPRPPAYLDQSLTEDVILKNGVNFASGGGGILNETGSLFIQRFSLYKQIELFQGTQDLIREKIRSKEADNFFQQARYIVALGSNDFINNYLMPVYSDSWTYNDKSFIQYLMDTLRAQLILLHSLGARELMLFGLGPMGCIPLQRVLSTDGQCQDKTNQLALAFNKATSELVVDLANNLPNASYTFGDAYDVVNDVITNPGNFASTLCSDRSKYVFWDEYHPSDSANQLIAKEIIIKVGFLKPNLTDIASPPTPATGPSSDDDGHMEITLRS